MKSPNAMFETFIRIWVNPELDPFDPRQILMERTVVIAHAVAVETTYERELLIWHGRN